MFRTSSLRFTSTLFKQFQRYTSSIPSPAVKSDKIEEVQTTTIDISKEDVLKDNGGEKENLASKSHLVKEAFASLKHNRVYTKSKNPLDERIKLANTPEELLSLTQDSMVSRRQAIKIVNTLSEWSFSGKTTNSNFESDPRFITLCQMVGRSQALASSRLSVKDGDLSLVLGVTGEDEAAKLISSITLPQMIKVLSSLASKRRRSIPLLRAVADNIVRSSEKLDIKQAADILYSLAVLNFPEEVLLERVCQDLVETIPNCQKSAVFGSICTSIGLLRYKDTELLNVLCEWCLKWKDIQRCQDFVSLLLCLGSVKHLPSENLLELIHSQLSENDMPSPSNWLDVVWSFGLLGKATDEELSSVLSPKFFDRISMSSDRTGISWKRKLLNLNGVAKWTKGYKGNLLSEETDLEVPLTRSKDKQQLVASVVDTLSNVFPSSNYFRACVDTGMGFLIDAECILDSNMTPVPLYDKKTGLLISESKNGKNSRKSKKKGPRIALLVLDYHDCTRGQVVPTGTASLQAELTSLAGYKVIQVPYLEYNSSAKLVQRAQYIEGLLKAAVCSQS